MLVPEHCSSNLFYRNLAFELWVEMEHVFEGSVNKMLVFNHSIAVFVRNVSEIVHDHPHEEVKHHVVGQDQNHGKEPCRIPFV